MKLIAVLLLFVPLLGCGVKGKPLPPLQPPPFSDGHLRGEKKENPDSQKTRTRPAEEVDRDDSP